MESMKRTNGTRKSPFPGWDQPFVRLKRSENFCRRSLTKTVSNQSSTRLAVTSIG